MKIWLLSLFLVAPVLVFANIVPCDGATGVVCQGCHLVQLGQNIITWLIGILALVGAIVFAVAGFKMVTSAGNSGAISEAKSMMTNVVIGLVILLAGWLIIDTVMKVFVDDTKIGPWNQIQCVTQPTPVATTPTSPATTTPAAQCDDDAALMAKYGGSPVNQKAIGLDVMINCYYNDSAISAAVNKSQTFTTDQSHPRCSLTNGNTVCEACSHSLNSCHYGRGSGKGAMAVDFNAKDGSMAGEQALFKLIQARQAVCGGTPAFEGQAGAIHTHINMPGC